MNNTENKAWELAPGYATEEMLAAGNEALAQSPEGSNRAAAVWTAMLAARPSPQWTTQPPTEQGWYWHWNGDEDAAPIPTSVLYSGFRQACFVSAGQLGLKEAVFCAEYGGLWLPMSEPAILEPHEPWR